MAFAGKWIELENIMLSEISQSQKPKAKCSLWYIDANPQKQIRNSLDWTKGIEGKVGEIRIGKTIEWIRYNFPILIYEYMTSVMPHPVQPQEWDPD